MKREYLRVNGSQFWHIASLDSKRLKCQLKVNIELGTGAVIAVKVLDHYPAPMCGGCMQADSKAIKESLLEKNVRML